MTRITNQCKIKNPLEPYPQIRQNWSLKYLKVSNFRQNQTSDADRNYATENTCTNSTKTTQNLTKTFAILMPLGSSQRCKFTWAGFNFVVFYEKFMGLVGDREGDARQTSDWVSRVLIWPWREINTLDIKKHVLLKCTECVVFLFLAFLISSCNGTTWAIDKIIYFLFIFLFFICAGMQLLNVDKISFIIMQKIWNNALAYWIELIQGRKFQLVASNH